jgi:Fe-S cluster assembly protein SufD
MTTAVSEQIGHWVAAFTAQLASPCQALREAAFRRFSELGFPTTHDEDWRFTNVAPIARKDFRVLPAGYTVRLSGAQKIEAAGSHFDPARLATESNAFRALNAAFTDDPCVLRVPKGAVLEEPIEIVHTIEAGGWTAVHPRILILVETNAQCTIVERYSGSGPYFTNAVTEIVAGEGAIVDHYRVQQESPEAYHVSTMQATLGRSANFSSHSISLGGALVRNDAVAVLSEGTEATLNGLYIANGAQHVDNHTVIDHAMPHGTSHELYKGILDGKATAVFNGRIMVRKDAQKTDSKQTNKNLVLSDEAVIDTKPELQIFADDVRCTHGATIGQIDAESMFYLRSRGIGKEDARSLLIYAFAQDIVDRIKVPALRETLERSLFEKFHEHAH